jgi:hypothetical protein
MNTARIVSNKLQIFDVTSGGIQRVIELPPGLYDTVVVSGDNVSVTVRTYSGDKIITFNMKTGNRISEIGI